MARTSTYLNFAGKTEEAFTFYASVFGTQFAGPIMRMKDVPPWPGMPELTEKEKNYVMHVALPILGGHMLMGTDTIESMGQKLVMGNNVSITLEPDTRKEADELFRKLSEGGKVEMPMQEMFWGDYFGSFEDKYGVRWMIDTAAKA